MSDDARTYPVQTAPTVGSAQEIPQTIIITSSKKSSIKEHFKHRISLIIGIALIMSATLAIILGILQICYYYRSLEYEFSLLHSRTLKYSPFWTAPFIYLCGSFAIVSAKTKSKGFIITAMLISITVAVLSVPLIMNSSWIIVEETLYERLQKGGITIGSFLLLCGVTDFICSIVLSALCCGVTCCQRRTCQETSQVIYLNSPPDVTRITNSNIAPLASGEDLPPPYSAEEKNQVDRDEARAGTCPSKALLPEI